MVKKLMKTYEGLSMGWEPQDFRSHSDASVLFSAGVNPIVLGPGSLAAAHMPEESVSFKQVVQAAHLYLNIARSLS
jgi:acetylornithine deacetylase